MPDVASKYLPLRNIVSEWSSLSGELPQVILRRICDWAICGGFPTESFRLPNGQAIDLLALHRAMRIAVGISGMMNGDSAVELLQQVIVAKAGVEAFCEKFGVDLLPSIVGVGLRSKIRRLVSKRRHSAPPDCPKSADLVVQLEASESAAGFMNTMQAMLPGPRADLEPSIREKVTERWSSYFAHAQSAVDGSGDPKLQRKLADMKKAWENPPLDGAPVGPVAPHSEPSTGYQVPKKRSVGRPEGAGSFKRDDLKIVDEMHKGLASEEFASISAAARACAPRAGGAGTLSSKEDRLRRRYAQRYPG
jgi:hypothetical protein